MLVSSNPSRTGPHTARFRIELTALAIASIPHCDEPCVSLGSVSSTSRPRFKVTASPCIRRRARFAFLIWKEHCDLHNPIERNMQPWRGKDGGPFSKDEAELIMLDIALGMEWLHSRDIVHRDLKASYVLVNKLKRYRKWYCFVADYECSTGVAGAGFFTAPEILQAMKARGLRQEPVVFSKAVDVYNYGMTCYEIWTGKLPFEGHRDSDYDLVLSG